MLTVAHLYFITDHYWVIPHWAIPVGLTGNHLQWFGGIGFWAKTGIALKVEGVYSSHN